MTVDDKLDERSTCTGPREHHSRSSHDPSGSMALGPTARLAVAAALRCPAARTPTASPKSGKLMYGRTPETPTPRALLPPSRQARGGHKRRSLISARAPLSAHLSNAEANDARAGTSWGSGAVRSVSSLSIDVISTAFFASFIVRRAAAAGVHGRLPPPMSDTHRR